MIYFNTGESTDASKNFYYLNLKTRDGLTESWRVGRVCRKLLFRVRLLDRENLVLIFVSKLQMLLANLPKNY